MKGIGQSRAASHLPGHGICTAALPHLYPACCGYRMMEAIALLAVCLDTVPAGLD